MGLPDRVTSRKARVQKLENVPSSNTMDELFVYQRHQRDE